MSVEAYTVVVMAATIAAGLLTMGIAGVNVWQMSKYMKATKEHGRPGGVAKAAWIISLVSWWTGPLVLVGAPLSIILGVCVIKGSEPGAPRRIAGRMAVLNAVWIVAVLAALIGVALGLRPE